MTDVVEVAVVGAGPTGLMLACELRLAGISVRIFERRREPVRQSRALTLHPRSLEVLALRGWHERLMARGRPLPTGHFALLDTRLDFSVLDTSFPFTLFVSQMETELLLEEKARELGVDLRRGHEVRELRQDADGVELAGVGDEQAFRCRARYVVGADGARSIVRQRAGIGFVGTDTHLTAMLGDVMLHEPPRSPLISVVNERGCALLVPLGSGVYRVIVIDPERSLVPLKEPVTLDELRHSITRILGTDHGMSAPQWLSRFGNETRIAETYQAGRVLLAGDAAHIHFPAGGQGLNVGVQDAMNLGWKLAGVLRDLAPPSLLESYHRERHPVGRALLRNTEAQTALMGSSPSTLALRELLSELLKTPALNRPLAEHLGGMDVAYARLDLPLPRHEGTLLEAWSGRRLPDLRLALPGGAVRGLYSFMHEGKWLWLNLQETSSATAPMDPRWGRWANVVQASLGDQHGELRGLSGLLLRPDGHVGWAWS